jgi:TolB-like protein
MLLLGVAGGTIAGFHQSRRSAAWSGPIRSLAVLPLANLSGDPDEEYFVEGMADALRQQLESISALQ